MSWTKQFFSSSIGKKFTMALSALFLLFFLLQHFVINVTSTFSEETFNTLSHLMGTNPLVQFVFQPVLLLGVIFHFAMGFVLEIKNRRSREINYAMNKRSANATWVSRNMIWSGLFILFFLGFHFYDFWIPEINCKYIQLCPEDPNRYYGEVVRMFENPIRVGVYVLSFVFLALHLRHGFQSAFQSIGVRHGKYSTLILNLGKIYALVIPAGFIFIALFHHLNSL